MTDSAPKLRPRDISALPEDITDEEAASLLASGYDNFVACIVAEARAKAPTAIGRLLAQPDWREDWADALRGVDVDLQVAVLRATYEEGLDSYRVRSNSRMLGAIRARLHQVHRANARSQRADSQQGKRGALEVGKAMKALIDAHPRQYKKLIQVAGESAGVEPELRAGPGAAIQFCNTAARWVLKHGLDALSVSPPTKRVRELTKASLADFDNVVAGDAQLKPHEPHLRHPLLLGQWGQSIQRLAASSAKALARTCSPMEPLKAAELTVVGLGEKAAYHRLDQLWIHSRLQQRRAEQRLLSRRFLREVTEWRDRTVGSLRAAAQEELRRLHAEEYKELLRIFPRTDAGAVDGTSDD